jgi:hypothetical protein
MHSLIERFPRASRRDSRGLHPRHIPKDKTSTTPRSPSHHIAPSAPPPPHTATHKHARFHTTVGPNRFPLIWASMDPAPFHPRRLSVLLLCQRYAPVKASHALTVQSTPAATTVSGPAPLMSPIANARAHVGPAAPRSGAPKVWRVGRVHSRTAPS